MGRQWPPTPGPGVNRIKPNVPEGVLDQLGQLGLARRGHRDGGGHHPPVEGLDRLQRAVVDARDDLRRRGQRPGAVAGVDAFRAVAEAKAGAGDQPGPVLEPAQHLLLVGAGVGRGLHDHDRPGAQVAGQRAADRLHAAQIGQPLPQRRGHRDHHDVEARPGARRRPETPGPQRRGQLARRHVLHAGFAGLQPLHPDRVGVVAGHLVPSRHRPHRQRQPHVPQARDHGFHPDSPRQDCMQ